MALKYVVLTIAVFLPIGIILYDYIYNKGTIVSKIIDFFMWAIGGIINFISRIISAVFSILPKSNRRNKKHHSDPLYNNHTNDLNTNTPLYKSVRHKHYHTVYLKSDVWKQKRNLAFRKDKGLCVKCGSAATEVRHLIYPDNFGDEPIEWLQSLCSDCYKLQQEQADVL